MFKPHGQEDSEEVPTVSMSPSQPYLHFETYYQSFDNPPQELQDAVSQSINAKFESCDADTKLSLTKNGLILEKNASKCSVSPKIFL